MATIYPGAIDSPTNPTSGNTLNSPSHSGQHQFENDAIVAIETAIGVTGSAVSGTVNYILSGVAGGDKVLSRTGTETATNKTLSTGTVISLGSDATGDMYYRNSSGVLARMAGGTTGQIVQYNASGIPVAVPNPAAALSSTTVNGTVQIATTADITAGNGAGSTGAILVVPASAVGTPGANKIVQYNSSGQLPAVDGSLLTNLVAPPSFQVITGTLLSITQRFGATTATGGVSTSNSLYMAFGISTTGVIKRYNLDSVTKQIVDSGVNTTLNVVSSPAQTSYLAVLGSNLYQSYATAGSTYTLVQMSATTLSGGTSVTISGTAPTGSSGNAFTIFSDGIFLYIQATNGGGSYNKYSISGTTATFVSTITFTNSTATDSIWSDGVSVYQFASNATLYKWPLSGGSPTVSSTSTRLDSLTSLAATSYNSAVLQYNTALLALVPNPLTNGVSVYSTPITKV